MATATTPTEVGRLIEQVISFRDTLPRGSDRDMLADACNTLSDYRARLVAEANTAKPIPPVLETLYPNDVPAAAPDAEGK